MGEISEMMQDGTLCQECGVYIEDEDCPDGIPRSCEDCLDGRWGFVFGSSVSYHGHVGTVIEFRNSPSILTGAVQEAKVRWAGASKTEWVLCASLKKA